MGSVIREEKRIIQGLGEAGRMINGLTGGENSSDWGNRGDGGRGGQAIVIKRTVVGYE